MSQLKEKLSPVIANVVVELPLDEAFELFTSGIGSWWPMSSHSVGKDKAEICHFEPRVGGEIYELDNEGTRHTWGTILEIDAPRRVVFSWHPGRAVEKQQTIEVMFSPDGDLTHVELVHQDWEVFDEKSTQMREEYEKGWAFVLGECYVGGVSTQDG